jgi:hypothetical protein
MTVTVIIRNQVHDFDAWKAVFDGYDRFRADHGVRTYRVLRETADPSRAAVELDLDTTQDALAICEALRKVWASPRSREQLVSHDEPVIMTLVQSAELSTP